MTSRTALLLVVLAGIAGCQGYPDRVPCDEEAGPPGTCCPLGSHILHGDHDPAFIICARDEVPPDDAGADDGTCDDASADAH